MALTWPRTVKASPDLNQRGSRANTHAGTRDRIVELRDREMAMSVAYESIRARCMAIQVNGCVDAALGASHQQPRPRSRPPAHAHVCEGCRFGGRRQHQDEQHTRNAMDHRRYPDGEPSRCQPTKNS